MPPIARATESCAGAGEELATLPPPLSPPLPNARSSTPRARRNQPAERPLPPPRASSLRCGLPRPSPPRWKIWRAQSPRIGSPRSCSPTSSTSPSSTSRVLRVRCAPAVVRREDSSLVMQLTDARRLSRWRGGREKKCAQTRVAASPRASARARAGARATPRSASPASLRAQRTLQPRCDGAPDLPRTRTPRRRGRTPRRANGARRVGGSGDARGRRCAAR